MNKSNWKRYVVALIGPVIGAIAATAAGNYLAAVWAVLCGLMSYTYVGLDILNDDALRLLREIQDQLDLQGAME